MDQLELESSIYLKAILKLGFEMAASGIVVDNSVGEEGNEENGN